jgi:MFS family permease
MVASDDHLIVTRVLLGLFESGFLPAASYLCFTWYSRYEVQTRLGMLLFFDSRDCGTSKEEDVSGIDGTPERDHQLTHFISTAVFFSSATLALGFSGLLAAAIVQMDGIAGLAGWRWIFILEGIKVLYRSFLSIYLKLIKKGFSPSSSAPSSTGYYRTRLKQQAGSSHGSANT